ncbi:hypothetical protein MRX96_028090 [Rhipicephalus microplus]
MLLYGRLEPLQGDGSAWPVYEEQPATPHDKSLGELLATPRSHFSPDPSTLMERFRFNNRSRRDARAHRCSAVRVSERLRLRGAARLAAPGPFRLRHQRPRDADATPGASRPLTGRRGKGSAGDGSCGQGRERAITGGRLTVDGSGGEQDGDSVWQVQSLRWRPPPPQSASSRKRSASRVEGLGTLLGRAEGGRPTEGSRRRRERVPRQPMAT